MVDRFTQVHHQNVFSRFANSMVGLVMGLLLLPGASFLLGWNEYRTIHRTRGLSEAAEVVQEVADPTKVDFAFNQKLIHLQGEATTVESLKDPDFGIARIALRLNRIVEMYQWVELKETRTREKIGGGKETIETFDYKKTWEKGRISSEGFREPTGHQNPEVRYPSYTATTDSGRLGAYRMNSSLLHAMTNWRELTLESGTLLETIPSQEVERFLVQGSTLYAGNAKPDPQSPQVGDLKIRFEVIEPTQVSILTSQNGDTLTPFKTTNGEKIESLRIGVLSASEMIDDLKKENTFWAWALRFMGWILASIGFGLISGPLATAASVIPILGRVTGTITSVLALLLGALLAVLVIGISWIAVRPILAAFLLVIFIGGVIYLVRRPRVRSQGA